METRIAMQKIEGRVHCDPQDIGRMLAKSFFEQRQSGLSLVELSVIPGQCYWRDVLLFLSFKVVL